MSDNRARVWFALFVLVVFCAGAASGIFIGRRMGPPPSRGAFPFFTARGGPGPMGPMAGRGGGRGGPPGALPPDLVERLASELQLDATQKVQVQKILDERRARLEQVHRDAREKFAQEQHALHDAIRAALRPDQQERFDRMTRGRR